MALTYIRAGQLDKAEAVCRASLEEARQLDKNSAHTARVLGDLGKVLLDQKKPAEAEPFLRECLAIRAKTVPDAWLTFNTRSLLGGAMLGQKKHADAEALLLQGYEGMKKREKSIPPQAKINLSNALDRLIELYTATNQPGELKKWQAERANYPSAHPKAHEKK